MNHVTWFLLHDSITFSKAGYCRHPDNWQAHPVDLCNFDSCTIYLDKMFAKAYELKNIVTSNIDLDTCVEIPAWRYWHLVVPFLLGLGNFEFIFFRWCFYGIMWIYFPCKVPFSIFGVAIILFSMVRCVTNRRGVHNLILQHQIIVKK